MSEDTAKPEGPDLKKGLPLNELRDGEPVFGHVGDTRVLVVRRGEEVLAFEGKCTHYGAPLSDGIVHEGTLRCPWHHARFSLEDGEVLSPPALDPLPRRSVSVQDGTVIVGDRLKEDPLKLEGKPAREPETVVIVGAGAAGSNAAETLRREGYTGPVLLIDPDPDAPYDRPNLSKDYLSGDAPEEWIPLRSDEFYNDHEIQRLEARVEAIDPEEKTVRLEGGRELPFGALLLALGSRPRTLPVPGADLEHVHTLRSLADSRQIIQAAESAKTAGVVGASFIGMEVAASLKQRGLDVTVMAPEDIPFESALGRELGSFLKGLHEEKGVSFRLQSSVEEIRKDVVVLGDGSEIPADLVVVGVGVDPETKLAREAGLEVDDGIVADEFLRTSHPDIYVAGDGARYPEPRLGHPVRIEHWVLAQRQGRAAARNILGRDEPFTTAPFFWTQHFGVPVAYVGHAPEWDDTEVDGECGGDGCSVRFKKGGSTIALGTVYRDEESLRKEVELEKEHG